MAGEGASGAGTRRALAGAVLLDLAVSPLFAWDVFAESLSRELGSSKTVLAGIFSVGLLAFMLGVVAGGRAADTISPRRLALVALGGTVVGLLGSAAAPSALVLFLTFGVLLGASTGLGYATAVRIAGTVAGGRGLALGLVVSAYAAGTALLAPIASTLLRTTGRPWTLVTLAAALGVVLALAAVLVPSARPTADPRSEGDAPSPTSRASVVALWLTLGLGSAPALAAFGQAGVLAGDVSAATLAVVLLNLGNFAGRLLAGPLSDHLGRRAALHGNSARLVLACLPLALGSSGVVALVALLLLGTQYGALSTLAPAATSDVVPSTRFGTTYGRVFTGWGVAGLVAPVAAATLATKIEYSGAYVGFLVVAALAWGCSATYTRLAARLASPAPSSGDHRTSMS